MLLALSVGLFFGWKGMAAAPAADGTPSAETFVCQRDGSLTVIPDSLIVRRDTIVGQVRFHLAPPSANAANTALIKSFAQNSIVSVTKTRPADMDFPAFTSFKINNKYNGNVFTDALGTIAADHSTIALTVPAMDRTLIPSFKFSDADDARHARAYVDGVAQVSKVSLVDFRRPVVYTLAYPRQERIVCHVSETTEEPGGEETAVAIPLRAEKLSSNYPSVVESEGLAGLIDGDMNTIYHSYWNTGGQPVDESIVTYVDIALPEPLKTFQIGYVTRTNTSHNMPSVVTLLVSNDGETWREVKTLTSADGIPQSGASQTFRSGTLETDSPFTHLRFRCDKSTRRNYLCLAELNVYRVTKKKPVPKAAEVKWGTEPYGRRTTVNVVFPSQAATRVPRIDITLHDNVTLFDVHAFKDIYRRATIKIDGVGMWPDLESDGLMKGRGNSTWGMLKKPYRIKFEKKQKPFGLTKGKSWVLLANALPVRSEAHGGHAHLNNAIAMKAAQLVGTVYPNHIIPVDLYVNEEYVGAYNFTEQIGISNNSVDLYSDSTSVLFELDTYDGTSLFDSSFTLPISYKDPDQEDYEEDFGAEAYQNFKQASEAHFNDLTSAIKSNLGFEEKIDIRSYATYLFVNDLIGNLEFRHPKSTFVHCTNVFDKDSVWSFGPIWDCDWAYGYERNYNFAVSSPEFDIFDVHGPNKSGKTFFKSIFDNSEKVRAAYYNVWYRFMNSGGLDALIAFIDDYRAFVAPSLKADYVLWSEKDNNYFYNGTDNYTALGDRFKSWLRRRAEYVFSHLEPYPVEDPTAIDRAPIVDPRIDAEAARAEASSLAPRQTKGIYNLYGVRLNVPRRSLPAGLYIIDGRKVVVR